MHARTSPASAALLLILLACSDDEPSGPPRIDEVRITTTAGASTIEVERGATVQLQARALRNGSEVPGIQFQWRSEAPTIAAVDANGLVQGVEYGEADIVADLVGAVGPSGRATATVVGPAVARIDFSPESTWVDMDDTLTLRAIPRNAAGAQLSGVELTWRSTSPNLTVEQTGRVEGLTPGVAEVEAEAWNGVTGMARVRVTPVTGLEPDTGRYGSVMRIQGAGLPAGISRVEFTAASGSGRVPAFIRSASATAVEVWVPAESGTGPIWLKGATDSFPTSRKFEITANDDIYEGAVCGAQVCAYPVDVPYHNPSLLVAPADVDAFFFELQQPSPISVYVVDRGERNISNPYVMTAYFLYDEPFAVASWMFTYDFMQNAYVDSAVYSHPNLPAGVYFVRVEVATADGVPRRRAYGLRITTTADLQIAPDPLEPNDAPREAAAAPITLPFARTDLALENPYSIDNYVFSIAQPMTITATLNGQGGDPNLTLLRGDSLGLFVAGAHVVAASLGPGATESLQATVEPGVYTIVVDEYGGQATTYSLQITATPASPAGPFTLSAPVPARREGRPFPALGRVRPERPVPLRLPDR